MTINEVIVSILLLIGTAVMLLGSFGVVRFGDVYLRMHAATKSSTLGIGFLMAGVAVHFSDTFVTAKLLALVIIFFLTTPVGAQTLARAAHIARIQLVKETHVDALGEFRARDEEAYLLGDMSMTELEELNPEH